MPDKFDGTAIAKSVNKVLAGIGGTVANAYMPGSGSLIQSASSGVDELIDQVGSGEKKKEPMTKTALDRMDSHDRVGRQPKTEVKAASSTEPTAQPERAPEAVAAASEAPESSSTDESSDTEVSEVSQYLVGKGWSPAIASAILQGPKAAPEVARLLNTYEQERAPKPRLHTVKDGETLETIAQIYYGNPDFAKRVFYANRGVLGNDLDGFKPGVSLKVPYTQFRNRRIVDGKKV